MVKELPIGQQNECANFWKKVNNSKKTSISSVLDKPSDVRPYAEFTLFGEKILELYRVKIC